MGLVFGTAPDSWGVWLPDHPSQPTWDRFLDEAASVGYRYIELGPWGYLPTDEARLRDELGSRDLELIAGTMISDLHRPELRDELRQRAHDICGLVAALGGRFLVLIADLYRDGDGNSTGPTELSTDQWREFVATNNELGRIARDDYGMTLTFHPHADTVVEYSRQVDRYLDDTDREVVHLCLDTGHLEYRDGDSAALLQERFDRIPYLHLKSLDPMLREQAITQDIDFPTAVKMGVMCEPQDGSIDFAALQATMEQVDWDGWAIVEQDMFPLDDVFPEQGIDAPAPIAQRTRHYFEQIGWRTR